MIHIKFNNETERRSCTFARVSENVVSLAGDIPANTSGFLTYRVSGDQLGDFSGYTTVYRQTDDGVWFSSDGSTYVPPAPPSLSEVKAAKKASLTSSRDAEETKDVLIILSTNNEPAAFEFDAMSQMRLRHAMDSMSDTDVRTWTTVDKYIMPVKKADIQKMFKCASDRSDAAFSKLKTLKEQVDACTTVEEVNAIKWEE